MTASSAATAVRLPVESDFDSDSSEDTSISEGDTGSTTSMACPRYVASKGLGYAPDLETTIGTRLLPVAAIEGPAPDRETVPVRGWYCETHDALLPQRYNDATADEQAAADEWLALPIRTNAGQCLLVSVRRGELFVTDESTEANASEDEKGEQP